MGSSSIQSYLTNEKKQGKHSQEWSHVDETRNNSEKTDGPECNHVKTKGNYGKKLRVYRGEHRRTASFTDRVIPQSVAHILQHSTSAPQRFASISANSVVDRWRGLARACRQKDPLSQLEAYRRTKAVDGREAVEKMKTGIQAQLYKGERRGQEMITGMVDVAKMKSFDGREAMERKMVEGREAADKMKVEIQAHLSEARRRGNVLAGKATDEAKMKVAEEKEKAIEFMKASAIKGGEKAINGMEKFAEGLQHRTVGPFVPGSCYQVMNDSFKPAITPPYNMAILLSNNVYKDKYVHLDSLAKQLETLKEEHDVRSDDPLHPPHASTANSAADATGFPYEDLHALAPTVVEPPTRLPRVKSMIDHAVGFTQLPREARDSDPEGSSGDKQNNVNNSSNSNGSSLTQKSDIVGAKSELNGWQQLRNNIDEVTNGSASKVVDFIEAQRRDLEPLIKSNVTRLWRKILP